MARPAGPSGAACTSWPASVRAWTSIARTGSSSSSTRMDARASASRHGARGRNAPRFLSGGRRTGSLGGPGRGLGCPRARGRHRAGWSGQPHAHRGAAAARARADVDAAAAPGDRAPDHGEPEPHPRRRARREERIEHSPPDLLGDSLPGVFHHQLDAAVPRPEREPQSSAARHGVERIAHEMPHGVPQRRPVAAHRGDGLEIRGDLDAALSPAVVLPARARQCHGILDQRLHVGGIARGLHGGRGQ